MFTFVPAGSRLPAGGVIEITSPFGTVVEICWVIVPVAQLALLRAVFASDSDLPATAGTSQTFVLNVGREVPAELGRAEVARPRIDAEKRGHLMGPRRDRPELVETGLDS